MATEEMEVNILDERIIDDAKRIRDEATNSEGYRQASQSFTNNVKLSIDEYEASNRFSAEMEKLELERKKLQIELQRLEFEKEKFEKESETKAIESKRGVIRSVLDLTGKVLGLGGGLLLTMKTMNVESESVIQSPNAYRTGKGLFDIGLRNIMN